MAAVSSPRTRAVPAGQLDVRRAGLQQVRGDRPELGRDLLGGPAGRAAADHDGPAAPGAPAVGGQVGVALAQPHLARVDAQPVRDDLRERGLVPLAVPARPGGHDDLAGRVHPHRGGVVAGGHPHPAQRHGRRAVRGPLGEAGVADPGAQPLAAQPVPLGRPARLGHLLLGPVQRLGVAALVVGDPVHPGVRELAWADHVAAAHGERIQAELPGRLLHQPLHHQHQLRPGHPAVGRGGRLVAGDGPAPGPVGGHLVDARQLGRRHQRLDPAGERERRVGAHVAVDVRGQAEDPAVRVERRPHVVALLVAVERRGQVLLPVLGPADRPAQPPGQPGDDQFLPADHAFQPEATADIGGDHPDLAFGQRKGLGHGGPHLVRDLGGNVHDELAVPLVPLGQAGPALQRERGQPAAAQLAADQHRGGGEDAGSRSSSNMVRSTRQLPASPSCTGRAPGARASSRLATGCCAV